MTIATEISEIEHFIAETAKMKSVQAKILKYSWQGLLESFFQETTTISKVSWRQYTDSFNDGDASTFGVHQLTGYAHPTEGREEDEDLQFDGGSWSKKYAAEAGVSDEDFELFNKIETLHASLPEDLMQEIYGDGFEVTVSKDGVTLEETGNW